MKFVYDRFGNLAEQHTTIEGLSSKIVRYQYDALGRVTEIEYPSGNTVIRTYDEAGRLHKIFN